MKHRLGALLLLGLAACGGPPPVDAKDPVSVARGFVDAFNARDLTRMLPLVDQVNLDAIKAALRDGPDSESWNAIFNPQMVILLQQQGGKVEGPRYSGREALVKVGAADGDVYAIGLEKQKTGEWMIVEHATLGEAEYQSLPDKPKK
jgi:hypothetical protein